MNRTSTMLRTRSDHAGFSLIELMIVVAIIGVLAMIAIPGYDRYTTRSNRAVAKQFLLSIASRQEQYILDAREYTGTIGAGGLNLTAPTEVATRYTFAIAVTAPAPGTPPAYTATATAIGKQLPDGNLQLDNLGTKSPADKWAN
jgi:type IV pilus assembly protein PilE